MSTSKRATAFDQDLTAKMALPNCLIDRLLLVYLNVVSGWCAAVKCDISKMQCHGKDEEAIENEGEVVVEGVGSEGAINRVMGQGQGQSLKGNKIEDKSKCKQYNPLQLHELRDSESLFADIATVVRILALLTHAPLGSWAQQKRIPTPAPATAVHVRLISD